MNQVRLLTCFVGALVSLNFEVDFFFFFGAEIYDREGNLKFQI